MHEADRQFLMNTGLRASSGATESLFFECPGGLCGGLGERDSAEGKAGFNRDSSGIQRWKSGILRCQSGIRVCDASQNARFS